MKALVLLEIYKYIYRQRHKYRGSSHQYKNWVTSSSYIRKEAIQNLGYFETFRIKNNRKAKKVLNRNKEKPGGNKMMINQMKKSCPVLHDFFTSALYRWSIGVNYCLKTCVAGRPAMNQSIFELPIDVKKPMIDP